MRAVFFFCFLIAAVAHAQQRELRKSIYFDGGSWYIDEAQAHQLSQWLDSIPNLLQKYKVQLISHTDPIGGKQYNEWLSQMRSKAVYSLLQSINIPDEAITIKDWGLENPVYRNDSWQGRVMNRRVDIILYPIIF